jgi:SSU ribosomal protein S4P
MVVHGHILVNGKKVNIPSYLIEVGDVVSLKERSKSIKLFKDNFENNLQNTLPYLTKDDINMTVKLERMPNREEIPIEIEDQLVVEYYSKAM